MSRRSHFVNCHGAPTSPDYFGQRDKDSPEARSAALVDGALTEGTVLTAECCYGAEIYQPVDDRLGMALTYLRSGAYSVFGSTTIAYGPSSGNDYADVICRLDMAALDAGASVGRAGLQARQAYVAASSPLDPIDLKTLAQFLVLGDPSVHAVDRAGQPPESKRARSELFSGTGARRVMLESKGLALGHTTEFAVPTDEPIEEEIAEKLMALVRVEGARQPRFSSFTVGGSVRHKGLLGITGFDSEPTLMHVMVQALDMEYAPIRPQVAIVGLQEGREITSVRTAVAVTSEELKGTVERRRYAAGSKSDHDAVMLVTEEGAFRLRRKGGNPFRDPLLEKLVGKRIAARGVKAGPTFIIEGEVTEE